MVSKIHNEQRVFKWDLLKPMYIDNTVNVRCKTFLIHVFVKKYSCIDIYANSCLKPFSLRLKAVFKQQNPCSNYGIDMPFEHVAFG